MQMDKWRNSFGEKICKFKKNTTMKRTLIVGWLLLFSIGSTYAQPKKQIRHHKHHKHIMKHHPKKKKAIVLSNRQKEMQRKETNKESK
jgi:sortase (surface protein transpeptidase)